MNTQHTPGPWEFKTKWCDQVVSNDGCICIPTDFNAKGISRSIFERRKNARLIAAAPELLDAVRVAENTVRHYANLHAAKGPEGAEKAARNTELADQMTAAIAKAEGGAI